MEFQTFNWVMDIDGNGTLSLWEIWETIRWVFRVPGSLIVEFIGQFPALAHLLGISASPETGYASLDSLYSKVISIFVWLPLLFWVLGLGSKTPRRQAVQKTEPLALPMPEDYPVLRHYRS